MPLIFFMKTLASGDAEMPTKEKFQEEINKLFDEINNKGASLNQLRVIFNCLQYLDLDNDTFQNLIRCLIPNCKISKEFVDKIMNWIFDLRIESTGDRRHLQKIENIKPISHILYMLTKPADITVRRIENIQRLLLHEENPCLYILLKRFQELNPSISSMNVPRVQEAEKTFTYDAIYLTLRDALKKSKNYWISFTENSVVKKLKLQENIQGYLRPNDLFCNMNEDEEELRRCEGTDRRRSETEMQLSYFYIHNISKGAQLGKNFRKLILPSYTLSLMKDHVGIAVLMFSKKSLLDNFFFNLSAVLTNDFILKADEIPNGEKANLLNHIINLHLWFGQGFLCISEFLSAFLERWDGMTFKSQIFSLMEWFVFKSETDVRQNLLRPLYSLFVISNGEPELMCDILTCLTNLIKNLFFMIQREEKGFKILYDEDILQTREQLEPILKNLSQYFAHLCEHGLYQFPCSTRILKIAIDFYHNINFLEDEKMTTRTIIPSSVLYHSMLSFNAQMLNEVCALMPSYRDKIALNPDQSIYKKMERRFNQLVLNVNDLINFVWTSEGFTDRKRSFLLSELEPSPAWVSFANLNNGLDILRHIMFEPYRSRIAIESNLRVPFTSKEVILTLLGMQNRFPHIIKFIETVLK